MSTQVAARRPRAKARTTVGPRPEVVPSTWQPPSLGDLTFVDMFCGAGGSSLGLTYAGLRLKVALNHWQRAIDTHATNFTYADHICQDVSAYDLRRLPRADILWASPICTELSPAGGNARQAETLVYPPGRKPGGPDQGDLLDELGYVPAQGRERTRATHWNVVEAAAIHRYKVVITENVVDAAEGWPLFDLWIMAMERLGYRASLLSLNSAHVGGLRSLAAPQWRDRMYCVFTRLDVPAPDLVLHPKSACPSCGDVEGVQAWSKSTVKRVQRGKEGRRMFLVGRYRRDPDTSYGQYWYTCPNAGCGQRVEPYVRAAAEVIDWSNVGELISEDRGLTPNTLARIKAGLRKYAHRPAMTIPVGGSWATDAVDVSGAPMRTQMANERGCEALVTPEPFITVLRTNADYSPVSQPYATVSTGNNHYLTIPPGAFYTMAYSAEKGVEPARMSRPLTQPFGAQTCTHSHGVVIPYYSTGRPVSTDQPFDTVTTKDRFGLLQQSESAGCVTEADLDELVRQCHYRMTTPRESLRSQRFPDEYVVTGNQGEQMMQAGNAVSANVAQFIGERVAAALCRTAAAV